MIVLLSISLLIIFLFYSVVCKMSENGDKRPKVTCLNVFLCPTHSPKPKDTQFVI